MGNPDEAARATDNHLQDLLDKGFELTDPDGPSAAIITTFIHMGDLDDIKVGDPVEVLKEDGLGGSVWQAGLVALSSVVIGSEDGDYRGEQVVWVGWADQYEMARARGDKPPGDISKAQTAALVRASRTATNQPAGQARVGVSYSAPSLVGWRWLRSQGA